MKFAKRFLVIALPVLIVWYGLSCQAKPAKAAAAGSRESNDRGAPAIVAAPKPSPAPAPLFQIVPMGKVSQEHLDLATTAASETFASDVQLMPNSPMPGDAFVAERKRWRADNLLEFLAKVKRPEALTIIGITDEDICTESHGVNCWGIFGLGSLDSHSCIISTARLRRQTNPAKFRERLAKVVVHEIGHTFHLDHCPVPRCIMNDAQGTIATVDRESAFCPACQRRLAGILRKGSAFSNWSE